jgi:hypothetical protein
VTRLSWKGRRAIVQAGGTAGTLARGTFMSKKFVEAARTVMSSRESDKRGKERSTRQTWL